MFCLETRGQVASGIPAFHASSACWFESMSAVGDLLDAIRNDASHTVREVIARKKIDLSGDIEPVGTPLFFAASLGHTNSVNVTYPCALASSAPCAARIFANRHYSSQTIATCA